MAPSTRECPRCKRPVNAAVPVCPFCGARAVAAVAAVAGGPRPAEAAQRGPSAGAPAASARAPDAAVRGGGGGGGPAGGVVAARRITPAARAGAPTAGAAAAASPARDLAAIVAGASAAGVEPGAPPPAAAAGGAPRCPWCCSAPAGPTPLRVESWKQVFHWNPGVRKFRVLSANLPGPCEACSPALAARRWAAAALMVLPILAGALLAGFSGMVVKVIVGVYGLYLVRAGSYGWADALLYGSQLEVGAADGIPRFADRSDVRVRFPGGLLHAAVRLGVAAVLGLALAFVGFAARDGRPRGPAPLSDVEVLSREKVVYFPVDPATTRWRIEEVDGARSAVGYTAWERVPSGPAEQLSPQAAFERALQDPGLELIVLDPGPGRMVVPRAEFDRMRLHLPPWPTPAKPVTKR